MTEPLDNDHGPEHDRVNVVSHDGTFSNLEVSPEQEEREFAALRHGGLESVPPSDGKQVLYDHVEKQVAVDHDKERVGLGLSSAAGEHEVHKKTIFGLPRWGFWTLVAVISIVIIAIAVGAGAGITLHNKDKQNGALAASEESSSLTAQHSTSSSFNTTLATTTANITISSSSSSTSEGPPITLCGNCFFVYGVGAHVWWSSILTTYVSTLVISINPSGKTLGNSLVANSIGNSYTGFNFTQNITQYVNVSDYGSATEATATQSHNWVEYHIVNQTTDTAFLSTQTNYFEDLQYYWKTLTINNSIPSNGTGNFGPTQCNQAISSPKGTFVATTGTAPRYADLPGASIVSYTTLVPFNDTFNYTDWESVGLSIIGNRLSVFINQVFGTTCTYYGGGFATIQVAVVEETKTVTSTATAGARAARHLAMETATAKAELVRRRGFEQLIPEPTAGT